ncbi:hypothetical protein PHMEG_0002964 [Phytophthora megakarya]|uniref:Uncharacterized protein n=1 Tax=Phytophthora megakarya TaxID=4795 RepID=A0A225WZ87_9STRA|nr:hypothetical protein PHMEG_0002964 [Phytophthora megakarya]
MEIVLKRFQAAGFKLKMKKCHWGRNQVAFLSHIVTLSGILPNPEKVKAMAFSVRRLVHRTLSWQGGLWNSRSCGLKCTIELERSWVM